MRKIIVCAALLAGASLAACSENVAVNAPQISPMDFASQDKTPGNYAVMVQSGAWKTEVKAQGWTCSGWTFPTDFETAYNQAAKSGVQQSFQNVTFTPVALKPAELRAQHFDAQIILYEGSITANFSVTPNLFTAGFNSDVAMTGIVAVIDPDGGVHQGNSRGAGTGASETVMGCGAAVPAIQQAGSAAIRDYVLNAVNAAKINILEMKAKMSAAAEKPTS